MAAAASAIIRAFGPFARTRLIMNGKPMSSTTASSSSSMRIPSSPTTNRSPARALWMGQVPARHRTPSFQTRMPQSISIASTSMAAPSWST